MQVIPMAKLIKDDNRYISDGAKVPKVLDAKGPPYNK